MKKIVRIGHHSIKQFGEVFIIAEAGVNHNGSLALAKKLILAAAAAGVDAVKFQTFKAEQVVIQKSPPAQYQRANTGAINQRELLRPLELTEDYYPPLVALAKKEGLIFLSTPHGHIESAKLLQELVPAWKVGSGDLTNLPFLEYLAKTGQPIILSTGMATMAEIQEAVKTIEAAGNRQIILLQCTTNYPCPPEEANVAAILDIQRHFPHYSVGYSDHTIGLEAVIMAVACGAVVIEKHFTLDRTMEGPDQVNSLEPIELKLMVEKIRLAEKQRGSGVKQPFKSELKMAQMARKSVVAATDILAGTEITARMLTVKRPEKGGLPPKMIKNMVGKKARREIKIDSQLKKGDCS